MKTALVLSVLAVLVAGLVAPAYAQQPSMCVPPGQWVWRDYWSCEYLAAVFVQPQVVYVPQPMYYPPVYYPPYPYYGYGPPAFGFFFHFGGGEHHHRHGRRGW